MRRSIHSAGFTLIEVLVAMVIMTGGIIILANAWSGNFNRLKSARVNNTLSSLLERKMTEIELQYQDKSVDEVKDSDGGDFGPMYPGYRWEMKSKAFEMPSLTSLLTAREGGADEMMITMMSTVQDYIKQAVKEICVTVFYKGRRGGELKHSVTTYLVDYTKDIPLPTAAGGGGAAAGASPKPGGH